MNNSVLMLVCKNDFAHLTSFCTPSNCTCANRKAFYFAHLAHLLGLGSNWFSLRFKVVCKINFAHLHTNFAHLPFVVG